MSQVLIEVWIMTDKVGSKCTRVMKEDREDWESMTDSEKIQAVEDFIMERGMYEFGYRELPS